MLENYQEKVQKIDKDKSVKKMETKVRPASREKVEQQLKSQENIKANKSIKENMSYNQPQPKYYEKSGENRERKKQK